uniref:LAGLIDADG homing endonuclease n=1 Tax=Termitomyces sp. TaxID=1916073 RepID=A0A386TYT8_9AGAR|nr:LAGLIDADG homing endonuclease [Termitomyces sp.]
MLMWEKLSNSGDTLKLMIPNYSRKAISGWNNYPCKVTSHKMNENEMGYRGSKSDFVMKSVKEQRVDDSWCNIKKPLHLRYTLMGFERNYRIKIPSKQLSVKKYVTLNYSSPRPARIRASRKAKVNPWFWTGLIDGEGSFSIIVDKNKTRKLGWRVQSKFQVGLHKRDLSLLLQLQQYLGGIGRIYKHSSKNLVNYSVDSTKELINLVHHLENYPLLTQKGGDFILFKQVVNLMKNKDHLSLEGLHQIINIKAAMNLGLSEMLKSEFNENTSIERPLINTEEIPDPNWISGFVTAEGCFDVNIPESTNKIGHRVQLRLRITQHDRDKRLMEHIIKYLGSGKIYKYPKTPAVNVTIINFSDITNILIPFFEKKKKKTKPYSW